MPNYRIIFIAVLLSGMLLPDASVAQEQVPSVMSLHDCMEYAVSNSTAMRIQAADRYDEQWLRCQAIMQAFTPAVSAQTYAYNQFGRSLDPETNTYNNVTNFHNGYSVSASITLFDGFQAINNIRMASTSAKMGEDKEQQEKDRICLAIMEAYANVLYYTEMERLAAEQVETARAARDLALRQEELGQKSHSDAVQMESELARKEYLLISAGNDRSNALITLKDVMFWPIDEELVIDTEVTEPECLGADVKDLETNAKALLPDARIATLDLRKAEFDLKSAKGAFSPTLELYGGWSTTFYTYPGKADFSPTPFGQQFRNNGGEYIEISLSIPIFDKSRRRTLLHQKKNALVRAEARYDQTMKDIENEIRRAVNDRDGAEAAYRQAERLAEVQREAYRLSTRQFELGLISAIEFQTASQNYLNAMAERMNSLLKLGLKDALVRYYNGEPYINQ